MRRSAASKASCEEVETGSSQPTMQHAFRSRRNAIGSSTRCPPDGGAALRVQVPPDLFRPRQGSARTVGLGAQPTGSVQTLQGRCRLLSDMRRTETGEPRMKLVEKQTPWAEIGTAAAASDRRRFGQRCLDDDADRAALVAVEGGSVGALFHDQPSASPVQIEGIARAT